LIPKTLDITEETNIDLPKKGKLYNSFLATEKYIVKIADTRHIISGLTDILIQKIKGNYNSDKHNLINLKHYLKTFNPIEIVDFDKLIKSDWKKIGYILNEKLENKEEEEKFKILKDLLFIFFDELKKDKDLDIKLYTKNYELFKEACLINEKNEKLISYIFCLFENTIYHLEEFHEELKKNNCIVIRQIFEINNIPKLEDDVIIEPEQGNEISEDQFFEEKKDISLILIFIFIFLN